MDDKKLVEMYFERDESAISATNKAYGAYCFTIAQNILENCEDSEECVNDTWLAAWNSIPPQRPSCLSAYLGRITRNLSFNRLKARKAKRRGGSELTLALDELAECIPSVEKTEQIAEDKELERAINSFLSKMPARERGIFLRRYWFAESLSQIASRYKASKGAVKLSLFRTRKKLRAYLEKEGTFV